MSDKEADPVEETEIEIDSGADENPNRAERVDDKDRFAHDRKTLKDTRSAIREAVKEVKEKSEAKSAVAQTKPRHEDGKFKPSKEDKGEIEDRGQKAASPVPPAKAPEAKPAGETAPETAPQATSPIAAPATAPKEIHALWDKLPQEAQAAFAKREADMLKGVEQIKSKLKPFEDAFAPVMGQLQQLGKTPADAAVQLINWQAALANPR